METMAYNRCRSELSVSRMIMSADRSLSTKGCMFIFEYEMPSPVLPAPTASQHQRVSTTPSEPSAAHGSSPRGSARLKVEGQGTSTPRPSRTLARSLPASSETVALGTAMHPSPATTTRNVTPPCRDLPTGWDTPSREHRAKPGPDDPAAGHAQNRASQPCASGSQRIPGIPPRWSQRAARPQTPAAF